MSMEFTEAEDQFRSFLAREGQVSALLWMEPDDVTFCCGRLFVRPKDGATARAERRFRTADKRGYGVALIAFAQLGHLICCHLVEPTGCKDAADRFTAPPVTLKLHSRLMPAREANALQWWLARRCDRNGTGSASSSSSI